MCGVVQKYRVSREMKVRMMKLMMMIVYWLMVSTRQAATVAFAVM